MLPPVIRAGGMTGEEVLSLFPNLKHRLQSPGARLSGSIDTANGLVLYGVVLTIFAVAFAVYVRNTSGGMVPLSEVVKPVWSETRLQLVRYQGFPSARIFGSAAPGASSGAAMAEMERLA